MAGDRIVTISHGAGGAATRELIESVFARRFSNPALDEMGDSAVVEASRGRIAFTTDSYVVKPLFFPGGDIGRLAIFGTVNDLAAAGARPLYISASFVIEEGLEIATLERIADSMAESAREAKVSIVAGDTKVVERGACDSIFITTSGVGEIVATKPLSPSRIEPGDVVLINGPIAGHGVAIMAARGGLSLASEVRSDCAPLACLAAAVLEASPDARFMRDATRGGLAAVLNEAVAGRPFGIEIDDAAIPIDGAVAAACELMGIDPLAVANEGKLVVVVPASDAARVLDAMRRVPTGRGAAIIGKVTADHPGKAWAKTAIGTKRSIAMPSGELLPRIC